MQQDPFSKTQREAPSGGCFNYILLFGTVAWIAGITMARYYFSLVFSAVLPPQYRQNFIFLAFGHAFLLDMPLLLFSVVWGERRYPGSFKAWAIASGFIWINLPITFLPINAAQTKSALHILLALFYVYILQIVQRKPSERSFRIPRIPNLSLIRIRSIPILGALSIAGATVFPWVLWGALGSILDTILGILTGLALGIAATIVIQQYVLRPQLHALYGRRPTWRQFTFTSFSTLVTLFIIATGTAFSFGGTQLLLAVVWAPLAGAVTALNFIGLQEAHPPDETRTPIPLIRLIRLVSLSLLFGTSAAAPLIFIDPDELSLLLASPGGIFEWAFRAAGFSAAIGFGIGFLAFILFLFRRLPWLVSDPDPRRRSIPRAALSVTTISIWALLIGSYFYLGQPGFFGDRLFVVLKDQADLSQATSIQDYNQRREFVYTTLVDHANRTQRSLKNSLDLLNIHYTPYYLENSLEVDAGSPIRLWLLTRREVDRILDSPRLRPLPEKPPTAMGVADQPDEALWNLTDIGAELVWTELGIRGSGIIIGHSDSGVQGDHPELADSYRGRGEGNDFNWFDPWNHTQQPTDIMGHGTHTLGTALGNQTGVAPEAQWIGCVNLAREIGNPAYYLDCMQFVLAPFPLGEDPFTAGEPSRGAHISNNSWGCPSLEGCDPAALFPATQALRAAGIFVAAAAGNSGPVCSSITDPIAIYDAVFTAGSIGRNGQVSQFSSRGPVTVDNSGRVKPDIAAPGEEILSAYPGSTYARQSGTSSASPHVTGVVALMWSANQNLIGDIERTEEILAETAREYTGPTSDCAGAAQTPSADVGYGILDAFSAVQMALQEKNP